MVTDDDIVELLIDAIKENAAPRQEIKRGFFLKEKYINSRTSLPKGRIFYTEHEIRQMIKGGVREITIPANAIISPLAQETLNEKGIRVVRS